jgi:hypothetical protein
MHPRHLFKDLLTPSALGCVLYAVTSVVILLGSNLTPLVYQLTIPDNQYYFSQLFHNYTSAAFSKLDQTQALGQVTTFLLWASVGAAVYIIIWMSLNSYIALRNDVVIGTTYTNFGESGRVKYWLEIIARSAFRLSAIFAILFTASVTIQIWYPISITMFGIWVNDYSIPLNWVLMLEAIAGWVVVLHLLVIFMRLMFLRTRIMD